MSSTNANPFTAVPDYDNFVQMTDFIGDTVLVYPSVKEYGRETKFGTKDMWNVVVFRLEHSDNGEAYLNPFTGVSIFAKRIVEQLDIARQSGKPIAGTVHRNGNGFRLDTPDTATLEVLGRLWTEQNHPS